MLFASQEVKEKIKEVMLLKIDIEQRIDKPLFRFDHGLDRRTARAIFSQDPAELDIVIKDIEDLLKRLGVDARLQKNFSKISEKTKSILSLKYEIEQKLDKPLFRFDLGLDARASQAIVSEDLAQLDSIIKELCEVQKAIA